MSEYLSVGVNKFQRGWLNSFLRATSYKTGEFVLASGKKSNEFLNIKNAMLRPDGFKLLGCMLSDTANGCDTPFDYNVLAGVVAGGIPLACAIMSEHSRNCIYHPILMVRKESKDHGATSGLIDGLDNIDMKESKRVLIIEDVITTGDTTLRTIEVLRKENLKVDGVIAIVDRCQGGAANIATQAEIPVRVLTTLDEIRSAQPVSINYSLAHGVPLK